MNLAFVGYMAVILVATVIGLLIFLFRKIYSEKDDPEDRPIFENYMPQYAKGHTDGIIDEVEYGDERIRISFYPRDIRYIKLKKDDFKTIVKPIKIIFEKVFVDFFVDGEFSGHRGKVKAYPNDVSLLPEGIKNKPYGKYIMERIQKSKLKDDEVEILDTRIENLKEVLKKTSGFNIMKDYTDKFNKMHEDLRNELPTLVRPKVKE